jgi:hypothetical protein
MATKAVIWIGPVSSAQVRAASIPDADQFIVIGGGCPAGQGDPSCQGSTYFSNLAEKYFDGTRYLPKLLKAKGLDPNNTELYIGSFSAGHGAVKKWCMHPDDRALIKSVALADSTYCSWPNKVPQFAEGYVRMCVDAVTKPQLFIATSSSSQDPAGNTPAGDMCMMAIKKEVEKRTGLKFSESTHWPAGISPQPVTAYQLGNCILADYGPRLQHPQHATLLAPQVWPNLVTPWSRTPVECFSVAVLDQPVATQGLGAYRRRGLGDAAVACSMWGGVPSGVTIPPLTLKDPNIQIDEGGMSVGAKLFAFAVGGAAAYALALWAKAQLDAA